MRIISGILRIGRRRCLIAALLTTVLLFTGGSWNPDPDWSIDFIGGKSQPLGFTRRGELVALEEHPSRNCLTVYEASSGRILRRHTVPSSLGDLGILTHDGERVVLCPDAYTLHSAILQDDHLTVVRVADGEVLLDDHNWKWSFSVDAISLDGRYLGVSQSNAYSFDDSLSSHSFIYDVEQGQARFFANSPVFSPDSQFFAQFSSSSQAKAVQLHALEDGRMLGKFPLPFPGDMDVIFKGWEGDRLEFYVRAGSPQRRSVYSCTISKQGLGEARLEPADWGAIDGLYMHNERLLRGDGWAGQWCKRVVKPGFYDQWNGLVFKLSLPFDWQLCPREETTWQSLSPETGTPISRPLVIESCEAERLPLWYGGLGGHYPLTSADRPFSTNGHWLVTGGNALQCWNIPPRSPWPMTLLVAGLPWLYLWFAHVWLRRPETPPVEAGDGSVSTHSPLDSGALM